MQPHTTYFICATPRSGSTLLSRVLADTGLAGTPDEFFCHPRGYGESYQGWDLVDYRAYIERVIAATATPNGVFGAKMMGGFVWDFVARVRSIPGLGPPVPLREALAAHGFGPATVVKKRGFRVDADEARRLLAFPGDRAGVVILTRIGNEHVAFLCERI